MKITDHDTSEVITVYLFICLMVLYFTVNTHMLSQHSIKNVIRDFSFNVTYYVFDGSAVRLVYDNV